MKYFAITLALTLMLALGAAAAQETADTVVISSDNTADSAVADALAAKEATDVVTTEWGSDTSAAVNSVVNNPKVKMVKTVFVVGGPVAVPEKIVTQLKALGYTVKRLGGNDRYETSAEVAGEWTEVSEAVVAEGTDTGGATEAAASATSGTSVVPVLFVKKAMVPPAVKLKLAELKVKKIRNFLSPESEATEIKSDLVETGATSVEDQAFSPTEKANSAITKAKDVIAEAEAAVTDSNMTKKAAVILLNNAKKHLVNAQTAYNNGSYGHAFGQAVASAALARNAERLAEGVQVNAIARAEFVTSVIKKEVEARITAMKAVQNRLETRLDAIKKLRAPVLNRIRERLNIEATENAVGNTDASAAEAALASENLEAAIVTAEATSTTLSSAESDVAVAEETATSGAAGGGQLV